MTPSELKSIIANYEKNQRALDELKEFRENYTDYVVDCVVGKRVNDSIACQTKRICIAPHVCESLNQFLSMLLDAEIARLAAGMDKIHKSKIVADDRP